MSGLKIGALILIVAGIVGLVYGQFSFNRNTESTTIGPIGFTVRETQRVDVPVWAGVAAIVGGAVMLLSSKRRYPG